jgi:hypothetical protein
MRTVPDVRATLRCGVHIGKLEWMVSHNEVVALEVLQA